VIRLAIRTNQNTPEMAAISGSVLMKLESYIHHGLYLLMFLIPIAGMSAFYAKIEILGKIHVLFMNLMLAIIVFHIIAGLYHQFILKDNLLSRMIIFKR
jgi:cytochrome b561